MHHLSITRVGTPSESESYVMLTLQSDFYKCIPAGRLMKVTHHSLKNKGLWEMGSKC